MKIVPALISGLIGASTTTLLNETVRRVLPEAPRLDLLGMRALAATIRATDHRPPPSDELFGWTMLGDIVSNTAYYSVATIGSPRFALRRGALLGLAAGVGAVIIPPVVGLGSKPQARTPITAVLTVAWYFLGGLAAGATAQRLE